MSAPLTRERASQHHSQTSAFAPDTVDDAAAARTRQHLTTLPVAHLLPGRGLPLHGQIWNLPPSKPLGEDHPTHP